MVVVVAVVHAGKRTIGRFAAVVVGTCVVGVVDVVFRVDVAALAVVDILASVG